MNTDRLIDMLKDDLEPVRRGRLGKSLATAMITGAAAAFVLMLGTVGPRSDFWSPSHLGWVLVKIGFALSVIGAGAPLLYRSIRPGLETETKWSRAFLPFFGAILAAAVVLLTDPQAWLALLRGATTVSWVRCLFCIVFFAAIPLVVLIRVLREGAPTRLGLCGALAGVVAGGVGAAAYAFNCSSDAIPFVAVWYSAAIALCALIGAQLGPWVLRW